MQPAGGTLPVPPGIPRSMEQTLTQPAAAAAAMIHNKKVSSRELTELVLGQVDTVNATLNAVVELVREAALQEAAAADQAVARGERVGALHGVPMTVKEALHVAGLHTTWGNPAFRDFVADRDATVVQRLRQAGAIILGTTNAAFMLGDFAQTSNDLYGTTVNPWDTTRTPGGSSGGSAVAVAAGMAFLEYGSDLVGSIRIPASFCGVYGLRPSVGTVPLTGFQPPGPPTPPSEMTYMPALGPLARAAGDLRTALQVTAGPEHPAAKALAWTLAPPRHRRLADFRVGVVLDDPHAPVTGEVGAVLSDAVDALARAGATVIEGWPDGVDPGQSSESFGFHVGLFFAFQQPGEDLPPLGAVIEQENRRMAVRAAWSDYFERNDVFLCPTNFTPAFPHDARPFDERTIPTPDGERPYAQQPFWIAHASLPGLPAVATPVGRTPGGLPVGVQILGPLYEDDTAITFAELLADLTGGFQPPPI
jgi:amidase